MMIFKEAGQICTASYSFIVLNYLFMNKNMPFICKKCKILCGDGYERKRLKDCYKIITNCVNVQCSFFNEKEHSCI